jgi:hypothetical protein
MNAPAPIMDMTFCKICRINVKAYYSSWSFLHLLGGLRARGCHPVKCQIGTEGFDPGS